jgi:hypothetical protein
VHAPAGNYDHSLVMNEAKPLCERYQTLLASSSFLPIRDAIPGMPVDINGTMNIDLETGLVCFTGNGLEDAATELGLPQYLLSVYGTSAFYAVMREARDSNCNALRNRYIGEENVDVFDTLFPGLVEVVAEYMLLGDGEVVVLSESSILGGGSYGAAAGLFFLATGLLDTPDCAPLLFQKRILRKDDFESFSYLTALGDLDADGFSNGYEYACTGAIACGEEDAPGSYFTWVTDPVAFAYECLGEGEDIGFGFEYSCRQFGRSTISGVPGYVLETGLFPLLGGKVSDLDVQLRIEHPCISDLTLELKAPDGTSAVLLQAGAAGGILAGRPCPTFWDDTILDDQSLTSLREASDDFNGRYNIDHPTAGRLSDFNGRTARGPWTLSITNSGNQTGYLLDACVYVSTEPPTGGEATCTMLEFDDPLPAGALAERLLARFAEVDITGDNGLILPEVRTVASGTTCEVFSVLDLDSDGSLTVVELMSQPQPPRVSCLAHEHEATAASVATVAVEWLVLLLGCVLVGAWAGTVRQAAPYE